MVRGTVCREVGFGENEREVEEGGSSVSKGWVEGFVCGFGWNSECVADYFEFVSWIFDLDVNVNVESFDLGFYSARSCNGETDDRAECR